MLISQRISTSWKDSVVQRIPKKNFTEEDLSTLRDISLLPTCYKILLKALCIISELERSDVFLK